MQGDIAFRGESRPGHLANDLTEGTTGERDRRTGLVLANPRQGHTRERVHIFPTHQ